MVRRARLVRAVTHSKRAAERGFTLPDLLLATALLASLALALGASSLSSRPGAVAATAAALPALVARARSLAETSGDGATLAFAPNATGFRATLYPHRPLAGSAFSPYDFERIEGFAASYGSSAAGAGAFAIFISPAGTASWSTWTPSSGTLGAEPPCDAPLGIVLGPSAGAADAAPPFAPPAPQPPFRWFTLACDDATLVQS